MINRFPDMDTYCTEINHVLLASRGYEYDGRKLGTGSKYKNMEVAESAAGLLIYKELDYSCIHGGKKISSISNGQRPNTR
jgi:hypothetical protein